MKRVLHYVLLTPALALAAVFLSAQQLRDIRRETAGTASLAGTVASAEVDKLPLRLVRVTVTGGSLVSPRVTVTDDNGRFVMAGLAAGQYSISADKPGYVKMNYGATRPARQSTPVVLADGQRAGGLVITMPRGAVSAGTVTNGAGEPEPDVRVSALYWQFRNGERTLVTVAVKPTDERGQYRLSGLRAGDYLVSVEPPDLSSGPADLVQIADGVVDRALQELRQPTIVTAAAPAPASRPRPLGPAPVFFPGTVRPAGASTVTVVAGEERSGVDIRTELFPMARVIGTVMGTEGKAVADVEIMLSSLGPPAPNFAFAIGGRLGPKRTDAQGQFAFVGVPPGEYRLAAAAPRGAAPPVGQPSASTLWRAFATLEINGDDRTVDLTLQPGMSFGGRVVFEGASASVGPAGARVILEGFHIDPGQQVDRFTADAGPDGVFRVTGLTPGRFLVSATTSAGTSTSGWALKSMVSGGRDLLDAPFEIAPGETVPDVIVSFADHPSALTGALQNSSGTPTSDYFIVVFSTDPKFWFPSSRRIVSVRPDSTGTYSIRNLPAGEYFISALTDVETGEWFDPAFLQVLVAASPGRLTIRDGEIQKQDLRVGR